MRRIALLLLAFALLVPLVPGRSAALPLGGLYGGELRVALPSTPSLDPLQFPSNRIVQELVYDSLTRLGTDQRPVPWLASSWTIDTTAKTITIALRTATWPDGSAITAEDVAWSYGKHLTGGTAAGFTATAVGAATVRLAFTVGGGDFLGNGGTLPVAWKSGSNTATANGPFVVGSQTASSLQLVANDRHWKGRPYLDRVTFSFPYTLVPNPDGTTRPDDAACAFLKGRVNLIGWLLTQNDLTNERDCIAGFGGFPDPLGTFTMTNVAGNTSDTWGPGKGTYDGWLCDQTAANSVTIPVGAYAAQLNISVASVTPGDNHDLGLWQDGNENGRCDFGVDPLIAVSNGTAATQTIVIRHPSAGKYLAQVGLFSGSSGLFNLRSTLMQAPSLLITGPARAPFAATAESPGLSFLYLGMNAQRAPFTDPLFRQGVSRAVDRDLIAGTFGGAIEPKTDIADSAISPKNLAWFNASVPQFRVPRVVVGTNAIPSLDAVNAFLNDAGYLDRDGDGWRDLPTGTPFNVTLLTVDQATDPRVAKYLDLITKFRAIGINVVQQEQTPAALRALVAADAFDLYVDVQSVRGEPAFLFDLFHSGAAGNLVNVASPELDAILERARDALDPAVRHQAVLDAQGWLALNAPLAPIVHQRALTSYDRLTFDGWVDALGGTANFWTFTILHVAQKGPLKVHVDAFDKSLRSGATTQVLVRVEDAAGAVVPGVNLDLAGAGLADLTGVTDAAGEFLTTYTAPDVASAGDVALTATAAKAGYAGASGTGTVTVHPPIRTLLVQLFKGSSSVDSGEATFVRVLVIDEADAAPAAGVTVTITIGPVGLGGSVTQATGLTNASGGFATTFTGDVAVASRFVITATVSEPGYETGSATTSIEVAGRPQPGAPATPALDTISMVVVVAGMAAVYGVWQRRKWTRRKP